MATVLYLSNNRIQAVGGNVGMRAGINKCAASSEISSCMFNGSIVNKEKFCLIVKEFFEKNGFSKRNITLVLNSNQIITRKMKVPTADAKTMTGFIANEFSDVERTKTPVLGYSVISENKHGKINSILAAEADAGFIRSYTELFAQCGIKLSSVQPSLLCAVHALGGIRRQMKDRAFIVQIREETGFSSLFFVDGEYSYSNYTRLVSEQGTQELGGEVARSVSAIMQFAKSGQISVPITDVFLAGFSAADSGTVEAAVTGLAGGINVSRLPENPKIAVKNVDGGLSECVFAAGGMLAGEKNINLLQKVNNIRKNEKKNRHVYFGVIVVAAVLIVMIGAGVSLKLVQSNKQKYLDSLNAYVNSTEVTSQMEYNQQLMDERTDIYTRTKAINTAREYLDTYPLPNSEVEKYLQQCAAGLATAEIIQYDSSTGELKFNAQAAEVDNIHKFIEKLNEQEIFVVEDYSGYEYIEEQNQWSVYVIVRLSGDAGRGNEN